MSGKFSFSFAKEAIALGQKKVENKCKWLLPNMDVVDDCPTAKSSAVGRFVEPSLAKFLRKMKSNEAEGLVNMALLSNGSAYSDPSFIKGIANFLLSPVKRNRLVEIGPIQAAKWSMAHIYQVRRVVNFDVEILLSVELNVLFMCRV